MRVFVCLLCAGTLAMSVWADDGGRNNNNNNNGNGNFEGTLIGSSPGQHVAGVASGGAPWMIAESEFNVNSNGQIQVQVQGLLISSGAAANTVGPVTMVAAALVCGDVVAAATPSVPLSSHGNATMQGNILIPSPCIAPAVLLEVTQTTGGPLAAPIFIAVNALGSSNQNQNNNNQNNNNQNNNNQDGGRGH